MPRWIETDTTSSINISSAAAVGAYTADADRLLICDIGIAAAAGNGDYVAYLTKRINGTGVSYVIIPKTTAAAASGETAIGMQSGFVTVKSGDVVTAYVDGLAGDTAEAVVTRWFEMAALRPATADRTINVNSTGYVTMAGLAAGAITSAGFAAGAINGTAVSAGAVTKIQAGLATPTNITALGANSVNSTAVSASAVTKVQTGLATPTNITAGTITTVSGLAANAVNSTAVSASAVTKVQAGLATPTNITALGANSVNSTAISAGAVTKVQAGLSTLTAANVNAEVVDALTVDIIADSVATDGTRPTIAQALLEISRFLMERSVSSTTVTVKKEDGSTTAMTFTLNDATSPTSITRAS